MKNDRDEARKELIKCYFKKLTICETLRRIYDLIVDYPDTELKEKITERLLDAITMARKMSDRLIYYKDKYNDNTGHDASSLKDVEDYQEIKKIRLGRSL